MSNLYKVAVTAKLILSRNRVCTVIIASLVMCLLGGSSWHKQYSMNNLLGERSNRDNMVCFSTLYNA